MNERIQELAYEAEDYADGIVDQGGEFHPAYTQRLAELIVQECGVALSPMLRDMVSRGQAYELIKQHFGVE
jgi:hypothetical protein